MLEGTAVRPSPRLRTTGVFIGPEKIILLLFIALVVLGPEKLPDAARKAGRVLTEIRRVTNGLSAELHQVVTDTLDPPRP